MITVKVEGRLIRWSGDVGALFDEGEIIADIQTADGIVQLTAPFNGRLTEMQVLAGEDVQAGQTIGWMDEIEEPAQLSSLIEPPAPERKLKSLGQKRKHQAVFSPLARVVLLFAMMATIGAGFLVVFLVAPGRVVEVQVMATAPVLFTMPVMPMPEPTAQFQIRERVLLRGQVGEHHWGEQGVIQDVGYEPDSGTWYDVQFGDDILRLNEWQMEDLASIAPTPTLRFDQSGRDWSSVPMALKEPVADFPAGTRVFIGSAMFNGVEWELNVTVVGTGKALTVREAQLEYTAP